MQVVNFTEARNNLKRLLDEVDDDADYTISNRRDSADAVVMGLDYFNGIMETLHLLESPANAKHLMENIQQYREGQAKTENLLND